MSSTDTAMTPIPAGIIGRHRLVGWGTFDELADSIRMRVFGYLVRMAAPVVTDYHGDLFIDATSVGKITGPTSFAYCVRENGTNMGDLTARASFASLSYNAVLYHVDLSVDDRGEWFIEVTLTDRRPVRPGQKPPLNPTV